MDDYSLQRIGYAQGLSNSAVLSLHQDNQGFMWFGTYDGLNNYDGKSMEVYRADMAAGKQLLNNSIYHIDAAENNCLWISTSTGINLFSIDKRCVVNDFEMFEEDFLLHSNRKGHTWVIDHEHVYYYNPVLHRFAEVEQKERAFDEKLSFVDDKGYLWMFSSTDNGVYRYHIGDFEQEKPKFSTIRTNIHQKRITYTFYQNGILSFVDEEQDLFLFDVTRNTKVYIRNVKELIDKYGRMRGIISFHDDIIIAFVQNGLVKLAAASRYSESVIDSNIRIFSVYKDPVQDIIWVGTDGQGVLLYSRQKSLATHLMFGQLQNKLVRQVRSIHTDSRGDLWFGTKGDGLIRVEHYAQDAKEKLSDKRISVYFPGVKKSLQEYRRGLTEYQVFGIVPSRYTDGFWIGSADNPGLSYYDYKTDRVIPVKEQSGLLQRVHRIYEANDSTLWLTTSGHGVCKVLFKNRNGQITADSIRQFVFRDGQREINDFFPMLVENDSIMWLGSRGMGMVRFNFREETYKVLLPGGKERLALNDILSIHKKDETFYLGTVSGLVSLKYGPDGMHGIRSVGKEQGFLNDMIHGILEGEDGFLWLSTNKGLIKYNLENDDFHTYYYSNNLQIGEFSDDAFYKCPYTGNLFFGGIDGLLYIEKNRMNESEYHPDVHFRHLTVEGEAVNFNDFYDKESNTLSLKGSNLSFSLSFIAPDFIDGDDFKYSYTLENGQPSEWTPFTPDNAASFKSLRHGDYLLKIRYKKDVFEAESQHYPLRIHIYPPWYLSTGACTVYLALLLILGGYGFRLAREYYHREKLIKELMQHESHNTVANSSHDQFHEATGFMSIIYRICGQMKQLGSMPEEACKMLDAIHETILSFAFKHETAWNEALPLEEYLPQSPAVFSEINLGQLSDDILHRLAQGNCGNPANLKPEVDKGLKAYLPLNATSYILFHLYSVALQTQTSVPVSIRANGHVVTIRLGLAEEASASILAAKENNRQADTSPISFQSHLHQWLYAYAMRVMKGKAMREGDETVIELPIQQPQALPAANSSKRKLLLLEDKSEIEWLVNDMLSDDYDIHCAHTVQEAFGYLRKQTPDVFLADTLNYLENESKFIEYVQVNKGLLLHTVFIPMLTWKASLLLQKDLDKLTDGFVVMPYNILFLKEIVRLATSRRAGQKEAVVVDVLGKAGEEIICQTPEQATFTKQLLRILDENLNKEELNTAFIADRMNISPRQYYRKFKGISSLSPTDFIKNYRIERAATLLLETDWSIQKVIDEVGIQSRSYFYKEFASRYGMTPKAYRQNATEGKAVTTDTEKESLDNRE